MSRRNDPPEKELQGKVIQIAEQYGWMWFHPYNPQWDPAGFPDLTMAKGGRVIFAELKRGYNTLETPQDRWRQAIEPRVKNSTHEYYLWYPKDLEPDGGEILRVLSA